MHVKIEAVEHSLHFPLAGALWQARIGDKNVVFKSAMLRLNPNPAIPVEEF